MIIIAPGQTLRQPFRFVGQDAAGVKTRISGATFSAKWHDLPFSFVIESLPPGNDYDAIISAPPLETAKAKRGERATLTLQASIPALSEPVIYVFPDMAFTFR